MDHDESAIQADFELSERLGAEILAGTDTPVSAPVKKQSGWLHTVSHWSAMGGDIKVTYTLEAL